MGARSIEGTPAERRTFRLSENLSVDLVIWPGVCLSEWNPAIPQTLTGSEGRAYRRARSEMLARLAVISHETV